jgi:hypothetical protein
MKKEIAAGLALVFIDIFNLAEQFGIYFISQEDSLDQSIQQRFFFILFGIGGATLIRPMFLWSKLKIIFSIGIEIGEFVAYLAVLPRSTNLIVVATIFFVCEVILHLIYLYGVKSDLKEIGGSECLRDYCCFPVKVLIYGLIYSSPILFLFLDPNSNFRATYYENLLILNVFFGVAYIDMAFEPLCVEKEEKEPSVDKTIFRVWQVIIIICYNILNIIIMITTMVFAGQAIRKNATGEQVLPQYDFGVYIYCLVNWEIVVVYVLKL